VEYYENSGGAQANVTRTQLSTVPSVPSVPSGATATINGLRVNLRQGPSVSNQILTVLTQGQRVTLLARNDVTSWMQVATANGSQGWVYAPLLQTTYALSNLPVAGGVPTTPSNTGPVATVSTGVYALNVLSGPGSTFGVITAIQRGSQVSLIGRDAFNTWFKVRLPNGTEGWASANYLNTSYTIANLPVVTN
jgi:uncharacterized protein YgiM (DUF1202 family)